MQCLQRIKGIQRTFYLNEPFPLKREGQPREHLEASSWSMFANQVCIYASFARDLPVAVAHDDDETLTFTCQSHELQMTKTS